MLMKAQGEDATTSSAERTAACHGVKLLKSNCSNLSEKPCKNSSVPKNWKSMSTDSQSNSQAGFDVSIPYYQGSLLVERQPRSTARFSAGPEESTFFTFMSFKKTEREGTETSTSPMLTDHPVLRSQTCFVPEILAKIPGIEIRQTSGKATQHKNCKYKHAEFSSL